MPPDNDVAIAPGEDVAFPQNGPIANTNIGRLSDSSFLLAPVGTYLVTFVVTPSPAGQLVLTLNGAELPYAVVGRGSDSSQITGTFLITTTEANSVLTVRNPVNNTDPLTITSTAGGTEPVSAHLVVLQLA